MTIPVDDSQYSDLLIELPKACQFIEEAISEGGKVLVHCVMGISRSATTVCAYLMKTEGLKPNEALGRLMDARAEVCPNAGFVNQLVIFERCQYEPTVDHPAYRKFKEQLRNDALHFISEFIDVHSYEEEKIFLCSDLPYGVEHTELLFDCHNISHLLTIRPSESTATASHLPSISCLHISMGDDFETDDLALYLDRTSDFIKTGLSEGSGVMIHSFEDSHLRLAFAAYLSRTNRLTPQEAIDVTLKVKDVYHREMQEMQDFILPRLRLFEVCEYSIQRNSEEAKRFMKNRT